MKKYLALFMVITCMGLILIACNQKGSTPESDGSSKPGIIPAEDKKTESDEVSWDRPPMVMIKGELYLDTNRESDIKGRCGVMDGELSSTVDGSEIPTQDNQSNFGDLQTGSYYFLEEHIDNEWLPVEMLPLEHNVVWTEEAWIIPMNDTAQWDVDWAWLYGELPVGNYRIGKEITDFRDTGDYDTKTYHANFEITN